MLMVTVSLKCSVLGQLAYSLQTVDNLVLAGGTLAGTVQF
jgi:hypothetical protein